MQRMELDSFGGSCDGGLYTFLEEILKKKDEIR